ncbi:hypothetical protein DEO72_LG9g1572 [Vigna unguiculata]|uniref:Uncharacterized protein n=1 Tax=Vigna unguiculata TaxID=3917 RepID=A0A4D6MZU5_VIGUN|nr:hypothetical protein DEO72_LG9g1572 [Vigna unguiculata]
MIVLKDGFRTNLDQVIIAKEKHTTRNRLTESRATSDLLVACTCDGSQTLQSLDTRGYHPITPKGFSLKLEGLAQAKGISRLGESFSPERGSKQRTTQTLGKFSLKLSCLA